MVKSMCLLAIFVVIVVCAEAIRIDTVQLHEERREQFPGDKKDDPRCQGRTALIADPDDCTKYIKCVNGDSREMNCPDNYKFDSERNCVRADKEPDCGKNP